MPALCRPEMNWLYDIPFARAAALMRHDPELAEGPLLVLAVAVGVGERVLDLLLRVAVAAALQAPVPLRLLENLAALLARVD
jgi:hypothetical protein